MNFLDAAQAILQQVGTPLHYKEIAALAIEQKILDTSGNTPGATMGSRLYTDTKKEGSRFQRVSKGMFGLAEAADQDDDITKRVKKMNTQVRKDLRAKFPHMKPQLFEVLIGELLKQMGFEEETVTVLPYSNDKGIDVRGILNTGINRMSVAVQAKKWENNVQRPDVQKLRGSLMPDETGVIITTSGFSKGAREDAKKPGLKPINLIDGKQLIDLLIKHRVGVQAEQHTVYALDDEFWGEFGAEEEKNSAESDPVEESVSAETIFPLDIAAGKNKIHKAQLLDEKGRVLFSGVEYKSPTGATKAVVSYSVNGWNFWKYLDSKSGKWVAIGTLREKSAE